MNFAESEFLPSGNLSRHKHEEMITNSPHGKSGNTGRFISTLIGLSTLTLVIAAFIALATWSANDPGFSNANGKIPSNWMGYWGASFADIMIQFFGLGAVISLFPPAIMGWLKLLGQPVGKIQKRFICWPLSLVFASATLACFVTPERWPLPSGPGGLTGDLLLRIPTVFAGEIPSGWFAFIMFLVFCIPAILLVLYSGGLINRRLPIHDDLTNESFEEDAPLAFGAFAHWYLFIKSGFFRRFNRKVARTKEKGKAPRAFSWFYSKYLGFFRQSNTPPEEYSNPDRQDPEFGEQIYDVGGDLDNLFTDNNNNDFSAPDYNQTTTRSTDQQDKSIVRGRGLKQGARGLRKTQKSASEAKKFQLPSLHFLHESKKPTNNASYNKDALEQNARLLEEVLGDFGVKGEIINVKPGPVVTLYELEPAPGIKSSRVIGLADDIARSMSAIAARVAVIPGRNAIGIELPNSRRETVYLREALASQVYENSKAQLPIILGKNIGGEPIVADLAKMPHLLVAGTTGSGKSVAINTMILSILYRLSPDQAKMIMIDPKMLELSIYDGIPHLLTPVVTDPKKAVIALKWTVREMEERYRNMSKLGVRNIDGYNARLKRAVQENEDLKKTVQTGFDRETGEAIYETEELDMKPMPYIVVVIDEMADLMMVAGKDIEGTVQRLAQMARAAGIHVVMATQRPSVDVITGTIKANFPTRISFQVTSKIDSRTILGEQGAEQLLGMGDMLYMAGGGRITRVHGPFVDDAEVEKVVTHLKTQGTPEYLDSVVEETEEEFEGSEGEDSEGFSESADIYDQAVAIVLKDRKVSTSYIQRRLSIGYNRAATLIERMEQEGLISPANHAGKREILVPAENETI